MNQSLVSLSLQVYLQSSLALSHIHIHTEENAFLHECYKQTTAVITSPWTDSV